MTVTPGRVATEVDAPSQPPVSRPLSWASAKAACGALR
jgi:hypothetical protein